MTQPAREESNSFIKSLGRGVAVNSGVAVGCGVFVADINVGGIVAVGKSGATGGGVAGWQAVIRRKHPMRNFFMMPIKTQLPGALFQTIRFASMAYSAIHLCTGKFRKRLW
jgi:hypothetical protein